jgi:hypothetical protein
MSETTPQTSQNDQSEPTENVAPSTTSTRTYLADDVTNQPTGEVEQSGPMTHLADHVPSDAVPLLSTKVVAAPAAEGAAPAAVDVETA